VPRLNKVQVRSLVRRLIDDPGGKQWPTSDLDLLIEGCLDELWGELLDQFSWLTSVENVVTPTGVGIIAVASIGLDTALLTHRLYRIQKVVRDSKELRPAFPEEVTLYNNTVVDAPDDTYMILRNAIWCFPLALTPQVSVHYSYFPEPFTSLVPGPDPDDESDDDSSFIDWPDGYHMAYIYDIASKALEKGDKEDSQRLQRRAEMSLHRLRAFLRKQHIGPTQVRTHAGDSFDGVGL
jgi:hypothetical protein